MADEAFDPLAHVRNLDGTVGPEHVTDEGIELEPEAGDEPFDGAQLPLEAVLLAGVQELFQRVFFIEGVVAEVIRIVSESAEQPHSMAEQLKELLDIPAETTEEG